MASLTKADIPHTSSKLHSLREGDDSLVCFTHNPKESQVLHSHLFQTEKFERKNTSVILIEKLKNESELFFTTMRIPIYRNVKAR